MSQKYHWVPYSSNVKYIVVPECELFVSVDGKFHSWAVALRTDPTMWKFRLVSNPNFEYHMRNHTIWLDSWVRR